MGQAPAAARLRGLARVRWGFGATARGGLGERCVGLGRVAKRLRGRVDVRPARVDMGFEGDSLGAPQSPRNCGALGVRRVDSQAGEI